MVVMVNRLFRLICTIIIVCLLNVSPEISAAGGESAPSLAGTWIGWAWIGEAGDLPLRFDMHDTVSGIKVTFDSPAHKTFNSPVPGVTLSPSSIRMAWSSSSGSTIVAEGNIARDTIRGKIQWGKYSGTFEIIRSPHPIADIEPQKYSDAEGFYQRGPGDIIELFPRDWGEMLYRERRTGRLRTLLPLGADRFFIGSALYTPIPVGAYISLERDASGQVREIVERQPGGRERKAKHLEIREEAVEFRSGETTLKGTLMLPARPGLLPGVAILGGSSWRTRDDVRFRARTLLALGFVTLVYDQRGFGESAGQKVVPFEVTARDALAAVQVLKNRKEVDVKAIGLLGMSRGGWLAPLAASLSPEVRFLILLVSPTVSPAEQETRSRLEQMRVAGFSKDDLELALRLLEATWRWVQSRKNWEEYAGLRAAAMARKLPDYVFEPDTRDSEEWEWARLNMFFEPCSVLSRVRVPVLAIFGGKDLAVSEAANRPRLLQCLRAGGNNNVTVHTMANAEHGLSIPTDLPIHRFGGVGDEGFSLIADWALQRFRALKK